jgi:hypothetical protein
MCTFCTSKESKLSTSICCFSAAKECSSSESASILESLLDLDKLAVLSPTLLLLQILLAVAAVAAVLAQVNGA